MLSCQIDAANVKAKQAAERQADLTCLSQFLTSCAVYSSAAHSAFEEGNLSLADEYSELHSLCSFVRPLHLGR